MKAAIYVRISRPDESEILKHQREAALAYCTRRGFELIPEHLFEDIASGGKTDRPGLNGLLEAAGAGAIDLVVFTSLSRMTRGGVDAALYILNRLESLKVGWHFVEQPILNYDDATNQLAKDIILAVLAAVDKDYRRQISEKTRAGLARRKQLGQRLGRHQKGCKCGAHRKGKKGPAESQTVPPASPA